MTQESALLLVGILVFLTWLSDILSLFIIRRMLRTLTYDVQQVKTSQRASQKRERETLEKIEDADEVEFESIGGKKTKKFYNRKGEEIFPPF